MIRFLKKCFNKIRVPSLISSIRFPIGLRLIMADENVKRKSDFNLEHLPVKMMRLAADDKLGVEKRTVATMCGAWRPEEEDGGLIFVFKTRKPCLSPDPTKECDYPENIEDFWEASLADTDDIQQPIFIPLLGYKSSYKSKGFRAYSTTLLNCGLAEASVFKPPKGH